MPDSFRPNSDVVRKIPLVDDSGASINPTSISYVVLDQDDVEIVASTPVTVAIGMVEAEITVPTVSNDLGVSLSGLRVIRLTIVTPSGSINIDDVYLLVNGSQLVLWSNTFQTYYNTILMATSIPNINAWGRAARREQESALIDSFVAISKLNYYLPDRLVEDSDFPQQFVLPELTAAQWAIIPEEFLTALKSAQLVESDYILGGSPIEHKRRSGLMSETIGESSNMFRPSKPATYSVGDRAYRYLQLYLANSTRISRA